MLRQLPILFLLLLACGCAKPPAAELRMAREALAQAHASGAPELAPAEYQAANATLRKAEELIRQGHFDPARELLPFASDQADQATGKALEAKALLEQEKQTALRVEEEKRRRASQSTEPPKKPEKLKPESKPSPPPLLDQYTLPTDENLWDIAARVDVYDDPLLWPLLYKANRDQIKDPRKVYRGQVLTIPRDVSAADLQAAREEARLSTLFPQTSPQSGDQERP